MAFAVASYAYTLIREIFNGDFWGVPVTLPQHVMLLNLLATIAAYGLLWVIYRGVRKLKPARQVPVSVRFLNVFVPIMLCWFIVMTWLFGVGVLGKELYTAPAALTPIIQITNRIHPFYLAVLHILVLPQRSRLQWLTIFLMIVLGLSRAGLGVFIYVGLTLLLKYHAPLLAYGRRNLGRVILLIALVPLLFSTLYQLRGTLRQEEASEIALSATELVFARMVGRLSSYSNSALILQRSQYFQDNMGRLGSFYFQQQAFAGIFGVQFVPEVTPERLLINIDGSDLRDVSFMTGTQGNMYISAMKSPAVLALNLFTIILMILMTIYMASLLRMKLSCEYALILLIYPVTSGVALEYSALMFSIFVFCAILLGAAAVAVAMRRSVQLPSYA